MFIKHNLVYTIQESLIGQYLCILNEGFLREWEGNFREERGISDF